jgi:broad specificity phosphatase PhoE
MRLLFVRHAQSVGNAEGRMQGRGETDLSGHGRAQAERLHARFQDEGLLPSHIYSSPQRRTAETARIVTQSWQSSIEFWDDLREHDIGVFTGLSWDEADAQYPELGPEVQRTRDWDDVPGAEKMRERRARGERVVQQLLERHADPDVVLVFTHGGMLQHIIAALMGTKRTWGVSVENTGVFEFTLSVERWAQDGDVLHSPFWSRIERFNDAAHLEGMSPPNG